MVSPGLNSSTKVKSMSDAPAAVEEAAPKRGRRAPVDTVTAVLTGSDGRSAILSLPPPPSGGSGASDVAAVLGGDPEALAVLDEQVRRPDLLGAFAPTITIDGPIAATPEVVAKLSEHDLARGEVIGNLGLSNALKGQDHMAALAVLSAKHRLRSQHLDVVLTGAKIARASSDAARRATEVRIASSLTKELSSILKGESGVSEDLADSILAKLAERAEALIGEE